MTPYFLCKRGVRQGDPLSPFLYILAALSKLFSKGRHANKILGLGPPCLEKRAITNCHYADDTILFLEANPRNVEITWWTMILFEALSGIKMNMSLIPINISEEAGNALAQIFGCTSTTFPIKYLGVPLTDRRLKI